ncbi:hypothetical protein [Pyruvatibacter sp.]|uniref:hypothetical protein n=1 Tax=Pyruvatibacter sp. TaxID=1981328 RepID=UPI003266CD21
MSFFSGRLVFVCSLQISNLRTFNYLGCDASHIHHTPKLIAIIRDSGNKYAACPANEKICCFLSELIDTQLVAPRIYQGAPIWV